MNIYDRIRLLWGRVKTIAHQDPSNKNHPRESQEEAPPILRAELQIPQSVIERYDAQQSDEAESKKRRERFEVITLVTGVVGLIALLATLCETRRATNAVIESSQLDKRAWVGLGNIDILSKPVADKPLAVKAVVRNSGESPAIYMFTYGELSLFGRPRDDSRIPFVEYFHFPSLKACGEPKPKWEDAVGGNILIPGADNVSINRLSQALPEQYVEMVTKGIAVTLVPEVLKTIPTTPNAPENTKIWVVDVYFVGCIDYFDEFRRAHRTKFCYTYGYNTMLEAVLPTGAFVPCDRGNDAD